VTTEKLVKKGYDKPFNAESYVIGRD